MQERCQTGWSSFTYSLYSWCWSAAICYKCLSTFGKFFPSFGGWIWWRFSNYSICCWHFGSSSSWSCPDCSRKVVLQTFATSTGLKVNFAKSFLVPINVEESRLQSLTNALGCQLGSLPFTYLGLPLGTTRPSVQDLSPILTRMEKHLMGISRHLSFVGRLIWRI